MAQSTKSAPGRENARLGVAILGCGVVGGGTAEILVKKRAELLARTGVDLELRYIVDKDHSNARRLGLDERLYSTELATALEDPLVDVVVELIGGMGFAKSAIEMSLKAGKHVVTANKALLAHHGKGIFQLAHEEGKSVGFEASCGGGIPIIRALYDGLIANRIHALYGIVNGTCNFILTEMIQKGTSYADALAGAQKAGFAEADPSLDVQGIDAAHKISILGSLAFGTNIPLESISVKGIDTLDSADVEEGIAMGYVIKLLAQAEQLDEGSYARVEPAFISKEHPLAWVSGSFNAVSVYGDAVGHTLYYGRGAGSSPTASAVVADLCSIALGSYEEQFKKLTVWTDKATDARVFPKEKVRRRAYLRLQASDKPGTLAAITSILGKAGISVASIHQSESPETEAADQSVRIVIILHTCPEGVLDAALAELQQLPQVLGKVVRIPILDEQKEFPRD